LARRGACGRGYHCPRTRGNFSLTILTYGPSRVTNHYTQRSLGRSMVRDRGSDKNSELFKQ
jgi:hypothetical protein